MVKMMVAAEPSEITAPRMMSIDCIPSGYPCKLGMERFK
jgi:hypothetical protein